MPLPRPIANIVARIRAAGRVVQRAAVQAGLVAIYLGAMMPARAWAELAHRALLGRGTRTPRWLPAEPATFDIEESSRQS